MKELASQAIACQYQSDHEQVLALLADIAPEQGVLSAIKAVSLALSGQADNAKAYLASEFEPADGAQWSVHAMLHLLNGRAKKALQSIQQALALGEENAVSYGRLAAIRLALGDLEAAQAAYQEAVNREAGRAEWHNNLAGILTRQQKLDDALEQYDIALSLKPELQQAMDARQTLLIALDRSAEVVESLEQALAQTPDDFDVQMRLARAYIQDNRHHEALDLIIGKLIEVEQVTKPAQLEVAQAEKSDEQLTWEQQITYRQLLANIYNDRAMHGYAELACRQILALTPENPVPYLATQVGCLIEMQRFEQAEAVLDEADQTYPEDNALKLARASLYCESERYAEAEAIQRDLLETYAGDANLKTQLGQTLLWLGKLDEAAQLFEEASDINPMALAQMVSAKRLPTDAASLKKMEQVADNKLMADAPRVTMGFALATIYDKQKDYEKAFHYLALANDLVDKTLNYSTELFAQKVAATQAIFNKDYLANAPAIRRSDRTPIFVVGMPRSGTTLTEQILCSHPDIFGAGELDLMARLTRLMPRVMKSKLLYPLCMAQMTPHLREEAARFYLSGLQKLDTEHAFVVDKMPHNFMHVGLIYMIFPNAKIVHIQRDPRDTALSNYQQNFKAKHGGLGYSFNQEKMAAEFNSYHKMMNHWREVIPADRMIEITYEELVADQEGMTRELLAYVGVEWDDSVKDFHKTERAVRTASVSQVRQPIYQTSKQKWRNYESYLQPFLQALEPDVTAKWDQAND